MDFTFGIITSKNTCGYLDVIIESIVKQHIDTYEIIIVGDNNLNVNNYPNIPIVQLPFNEHMKTSWITKKKNILCQHAKYENIVLIHDYIKLETGWYEGFKRYGNNFQFCINPIQRIDGSRYRDYLFFTPIIEHIIGNEAFIPYNVEIPQPLNTLLYISGAYYVIKRDIALKYPLCENLAWGEGEDVVLSKELTCAGINIQCNPYSVAKLLKHKGKIHFENEMSREKCAHLLGLDATTVTNYNKTQKFHLINELKNLCSNHIKLLLE
jgi:hypothetical protein